MATLITRANGRREVQLTKPTGGRGAVRLGRVTERQALQIQGWIERLLAARLMDVAPDEATARWVGDLSPTLRKRLAACDLLPRQAVCTLAELIADFNASLAVKPSTRRNLRHVHDNLLAYFGPNHLLRDFTPADAKAFRAWLATSGHQDPDRGPLAKATISRRTRRAKQLFAHAVDRRWLADNPFAGEKGWDEVNRERDFRVTVGLFKRVLAEVPSLEFRAFLTVVRFAALRSPSESRPLLWEDVNWEHGSLTVRRQKTAHRIVPLFPEVAEALDRIWQQAAEGEPLVFPECQVGKSALTSRLERACRAAGIVMWPRPWKNMRATRESELVANHPLPVVTAWMGHSPQVAQAHYFQVFEEHHQQAIRGDTLLRLDQPTQRRSKKRSSSKVPSRHLGPA